VRRGSRDLIIVMVLATAGLALALWPAAPALLSAPLGLALVMALPGYALIAAMDPWRETGGVELLTLRIGVSIVITILAGLLLNLTPWGLQRAPWGVMLAGVTLASAATAMARRRAVAPPPNAGTIRAPALRLRPIQVVLLALAALVLVSAVNMARSGALNQPNQGFTQLWMLAEDGATTGTVRLGVSNQEQKPQHYLLRVTDGKRMLGEWPNLDLQPGAQWEITLVLPAKADTTTPFEASLYRADDLSTVYRHTLLWSGTGTPGQ
jgi:uncharacterized membrane protein